MKAFQPYPSSFRTVSWKLSTLLLILPDSLMKTVHLTVLLILLDSLMKTAHLIPHPSRQSHENCPPYLYTGHSGIKKASTFPTSLWTVLWKLSSLSHSLLGSFIKTFLAYCLLDSRVGRFWKFSQILTCSQFASLFKAQKDIFQNSLFLGLKYTLGGPLKFAFSEKITEV